jgi:hypothetical protein
LSGFVFNELHRCDEPNCTSTPRDAVMGVMGFFPGPFMFVLTSGHTEGQ